MPYSSVQFIAWAINTDVKSDGSVESYVGLLPAKTDITERIKLLRRAMEQVRICPETKADPSVLKLFMFPEFYFRGKEGAYRMDDARAVVDELLALVNDKAEWDHWIFAFGTIVSANFDPAISLAKPLPPGTEIDAFNYCVVQKGGVIQADGHAIIKRTMGASDFIVDAITLGSAPVQYPDPLEGGRFSEVQAAEDHEHGSVFTLGDLTFGVEVCADHAAGRLYNARKLPTIDIHLVPSCGAHIIEKFVVAKTGGYAFGCDGASTFDGKPGSSSELLRVGTGRITPFKVPVDARDTRVDEIYALGAGELHIYPVQLLG